MRSPFVAAAVLGLGLLLVTGELLRRRQLREKHAALWIVVGAASLALTAIPGLLPWLADQLGFSVPANLLFLVGGVVLAAIAMQLSLEVGFLEDKSQRLAEELALLRLAVEELTERLPGAPADPREPREPHA